jgi:hypothetical protein
MKKMTIDWQQARQILNEAYRPSISLRPIFAELMGNSLTIGMYLSRAHYWSDKGRDSDGWIYKTCDEFKSETFLSRRQQDKAREALKDKPWWSEKLARVGSTPKFHYRIDRDLLDAEVINFILSKCEDNLTASDSIASGKSDSIASGKSDSIASGKSDLPTAIAYTKIYSSKTYSPDLTHSLTESPEKSANAEPENLIFLDPETSQQISPLETFSNIQDEGIHLLTREEGVQTLLDGTQEIINPSFAVDPDPSGGKEVSAPCRTTADTMKGMFGNQRPIERQRATAKTQPHYHKGNQNPTQRWKDLEDYKKFEAYVVENARQRREGIIKCEKGEYGEPWIQSVLRFTSTCTNEFSSKLQIWKDWNSIVPSPEFLPIEENVAKEFTEEEKEKKREYARNLLAKMAAGIKAASENKETPSRGFKFAS